MATEAARCTSESGDSRQPASTTQRLHEWLLSEVLSDRQPATGSRDRLGMGRRDGMGLCSGLKPDELSIVHQCLHAAASVLTVWLRDLHSRMARRPRQINYPRPDIGGQGGGTIPW
jgi:hypothetical protein